MKGLFPPITLQAGKADWTPRDKLARLVELSRSVGYWTDPKDADPAELAEERALFDELSAALDSREVDDEQ
jgi:hypothetical protein